MDFNKITNEIKEKGFEVTLGQNSANPNITEIVSDKGYTLSYLPECEKNWLNIKTNEDDLDWGWGILNDEDGYLVNDKSYFDDTKKALEKFIDILKNGE